ncbi:MAG TPA: hypothetical protein VGB03_01250 [Acidimicrobiales bacterium]|jgi:predicted membrane channel-forming protein YqfA (hemolysin III family)
MADTGRANGPALVVLIVDAAAALGFGITYSGLLGYLLVTADDAEFAVTYPTGTQAAIILFCLTVAIAVVGVAAAIVAVHLYRRTRIGVIGARALLGVVTLVTLVAAFTAHAGFDLARSPRWLFLAAVHGAALASLRGT